MSKIFTENIGLKLLALLLALALWFYVASEFEKDGGKGEQISNKISAERR